MKTIPNFVDECGASLLVTDFTPLRQIRKGMKVHEVDAHNVVPLWLASEKLEYSAKTIHGNINKFLPKYLIDFPVLQSRNEKWDMEKRSVDWDNLIDVVLCEGAAVPKIEWCEPGEKAAMEVLKGK